MLRNSSMKKTLKDKSGLGIKIFRKINLLFLFALWFLRLRKSCLHVLRLKFRKCGWFFVD